MYSTYQIYIKFTFDDLFQFICMQNGYGPAMRVKYINGKKTGLKYDK